MTAGTNLHCSIDNLIPDIVFSLHILLSVNSKKYHLRYAQHKGFICFNWVSASGLKIDQNRKLQWQKLSET